MTWMLILFMSYKIFQETNVFSSTVTTTMQWNDMNAYIFCLCEVSYKIFKETDVFSSYQTVLKFWINKTGILAN